MFVLNKVHLFLVRLIWERQMLVIITKNDKYLNSIFFFNFLKSKTVLKVLLALITVNKNLEYVHILERKKYSLVQFSWKKSVVFLSSLLKMTISFNKNFYKSIVLYYCLLVTLKVSKLFLYISIVKETEMA